MTVDSGDTAFMLVSMALVQLMTPGLAFFYGGLCRKSCVGTMMMQSWAAMAVITVLWFVGAFSLCFGHGYGVLGDPSSFAMFQDLGHEPMTHRAREGHAIHSEETVFVDGIPGLVFAGYQGMFAVITPALMTGCFAERVHFLPYLLFISLWLLLVYCPFCHWVWGPGGWLYEWGVRDFAGGLVVHTTAGWSALATLFVVGSRPEEAVMEGEDLHTPHNIPFVALGTGLLWFGWFGFNAGSALGANSVAAFAAVNSEIAASTAMFAWMLIDWYRFGKPKLVGLCVGAIAGLATVTPCAGFIQPWGAFVLGWLAAGVCYLCCELRQKLRWDDALDVWGVHGCGGFLGTVLVGALADEGVNGVHRSGELLGKQLAAAAFTAAYSFVVSFLLLAAIAKVLRLTPTKEEVRSGLDMSMHGEQAYSDGSSPAGHTPTLPTLNTLKV